MDYRLSPKDRNYIWHVVHHAAESVGGYQKLFSSPLEFSENENRIQFNWPTWMRAIKAYVVSQYGEKALDDLILEILSEIYSPEKYKQFVEGLNVTDDLEVVNVNQMYL